MGRHICLKEWINGNEISVSMDDNLCNKFRAEVIVFHNDDNIRNRTEIGFSNSPTHMAKLIVEAKKMCKGKERNKGNISDKNFELDLKQFILYGGRYSYI